MLSFIIKIKILYCLYFTIESKKVKNNYSLCCRGESSPLRRVINKGFRDKIILSLLKAFFYITVDVYEISTLQFGCYIPFPFMVILCFCHFRAKLCFVGQDPILPSYSYKWERKPKAKAGHVETRSVWLCNEAGLQNKSRPLSWGTR